MKRPELFEVVEGVCNSIIHIHAEFPNNAEAIAKASRVHNWVGVFDPRSGEYKFSPVKYCGYDLGSSDGHVLSRYYKVAKIISGTESKVNLLRDLGFVERKMDDPSVSSIADSLQNYMDNDVGSKLRRGATLIIHPLLLNLSKRSRQLLKEIENLGIEQRECVFLKLESGRGLGYCKRSNYLKRTK